MAELLDILNAFTTQLKVAWVVWIAWGIGQIFWYRYERRPKTAVKTSARKPFVSKPSLPERPMTRLVTPEQVMPEPAYVDSAPATLEGTGEIGEQLDKFVANFEMNTRHRREQPLNGEHSPFDAQQGR
jgi:hypothetical protein